MSRFLLSGGASGVVRWGYHTAARLGAWTIGEQGTHVRAVLTEVNETAIGQSPLWFEVPVAGSTWRWPIRDLAIAGTTVTLTVGPRETR